MQRTYIHGYAENRFVSYQIFIMKVLITGATGFIGKALCEYLGKYEFDLRIAVRQKKDCPVSGYEIAEVGDIGPQTAWENALVGVDTIVHLAGIAHITDGRKTGLADDFYKVNVLGTERLARVASSAGVKRFVFVSSVKVNGEGSLRPYTEIDIPEPGDDYGISKHKAEYLLNRIAAQTDLKTVILRPPLVYGPGVKANFRNLIRIIGLGLPLPFKSINNRRSFIYVGNLVDAIMACILHPRAAGETFMVSDRHDLSTPALIEIIASAMNKKPRLFHLHCAVLNAICGIIGRSDEIDRLTGTLFVDSSKIKNMLGWKPRFSVEEGIAETVRFRRNKSNEKNL